MIGFTLALSQAKRSFFDRNKVQNAMDKTTGRVLSRFGAFVRTRAKTSMRKREGTSKPGQPPFAHTGLLRKWILFAYERAQQNVIIGPLLANKIFLDGDGKPRTGTVPEVLEYGGTIGIIEVFKHGRWQRADLRSKRRLAGLKMRRRFVDIAARPYMRPAHAAELKQLSKLWSNAMNRAG